MNNFDAKTVRRLRALLKRRGYTKKVKSEELSAVYRLELIEKLGYGESSHADIERELETTRSTLRREKAKK